MKRILVLGAGAMGSAFTVPCVDNKNDVVLVGSHLEDLVTENIIKEENFHKALNCKLPKNLKVEKFEKFQDEIKKKPDLIVIGVNSKGIEWAGKEISKNFNSSSSILLLTKGLTVINGKFETLVEKFKLILKNNGINNAKVSAVGGPCLASGLANRIKSSVVLSNKKIEIVKSIRDIISTNYYTVECSNDLIGVETCAAIKNIYSMIIGASEGLSGSNVDKEIKSKYFLNTAASLMYRAISEMNYFTKKLKGKEETVYGLAGLGDLYVSSAGGRNSKMGKYLGEGYDYKTAKEKFMKNDTIEGAELVFEIGTKILKDFDKTKIPLMTSLIKSIIDNKKLEIKW
ncbi:MAG: 2-dehydropantoate 2-reductase N-terminal domain-containing protein [Alphaproteobacteria bacterium]|jgi:glycerol-3-phosphate dehydrogenase (NAD(P)+)|nr:2-dehydropantoate 2-reductase N-terminal domain-containing protein [Alphaproteobacteria bacterium]